MKILIVEDDNMIREGLSEYLSEFGYTVIQAKDISQNVHTNIFCSWNNNYISSFISFFYLS